MVQTASTKLVVWSCQDSRQVRHQFDDLLMDYYKMVVQGCGFLQLCNLACT